jgi:two-component system, cell cycle response regulator
MQKVDDTDHTIVKSMPDMEEGTQEKQPYILFQQGPLFGKMVLLQTGSIVLGRSPEADIEINDEGISRKHIKLSFRQGKAIVTDLNSTNGTFVNGERVDERELQHEDKIQISSSTLMKYLYADKLDESTQHELYNMGHRDPLTNAYNKRHFMDRLTGEFSYAERKGTPLSLIMFDIDHFKNTNDTYGHPAGDFVLMRLSTLAQSIIREEDVYARYGGEEFAIILKGTDRQGARVLAERLRKLVEEHEFLFDGQRIPTTISIGVCSVHDGNISDSDALIKKTDSFLYNSKNSGRNQVTAG